MRGAVATIKCPICGAEAPPRPQNRFGPFCSERCKLVDLGKWMTGEYRIPVAPGPEDEDGEGAGAARGGPEGEGDGGGRG